MSRYQSFIVFVSLLSLAIFSSFAEAEECTSTVSPDLATVHIPAVEFNGQLYSGDMERVPSNDGSIWFEVTGMEATDSVECENPALVASAFGSYFLLVPLAEFVGNEFEAVLEYDPNTTAPAGINTSESDAGGRRFKVRKANRKSLMEPQGTERIPTSLRFSSRIVTDQGIGGWILELAASSDQIKLGERIATPTQWIYGPSSGQIYVSYPYCAHHPHPEAPELTGKCSASGTSRGIINIDELVVDYSDPLNAKISMKYKISFPLGQMVINYKIFWNGNLVSDENEDRSDAFTGGYYSARSFTKELLPGGKFIGASKWEILPGLGLPCNDCGWPFAQKSYPDHEIPWGPGAVFREIGTRIVLYE